MENDFEKNGLTTFIHFYASKPAWEKLTNGRGDFL